MARLAALSSATPSLQAAMMRSRVEQARREADQAQAYADDLRQQLAAQEQTTQQAQGRVQSLERGIEFTPNPAPAADRPSETPASQTTTVPSTPEPTYINTLSAAFKVAQPILAMDLSVQQKNVVKASLFEATNTLTSTPTATTAATAVARSYAPQSGMAAPLSTGSLLNQSV